MTREFPIRQIRQHPVDQQQVRTLPRYNARAAPTWRPSDDETVAPQSERKSGRESAFRLHDQYMLGVMITIRPDDRLYYSRRCYSA